MATRFELAHASSTAVCPAPRGLTPHTMHANEDNRGPNGKQRCPIYFQTQSKTSNLLMQATTSNLLAQATTPISSTLPTAKPLPYLAPRTTLAPLYMNGRNKVTTNIPPTNAALSATRFARRSSLRSSSHLVSPFFSPAGTAARRARVHKVRSRLPLFRALIMIIGRPLLRLVEGIATRVAKGVSAAFYFTQSKVEVGSWDIRCDDD